MLHMGLNGLAEGIFGSLHIVASTATMDVQVNTSGHNAAAFGVYHLCSFY